MIFRPLQGCEGMSKVLHISLNILFSLKSVRKKALLNTPCYVKEREKFTTVIIIECSQKLINPLWVSGVVFLFSQNVPWNLQIKILNYSLVVQKYVSTCHAWGTQYIFNFPITILKGQQIHDFRESRTSTVAHLFYPWCTIFDVMKLGFSLRVTLISSTGQLYRICL